MSQPDRQRGPIFIVGAMGSGTTLLRLMLDSHEHIAIPPETGFMRAYDALRFTPFKFSGRNWTKRLGWSQEEFDAVARELFDRLFMRYAEAEGKRRWGDKTPLHTWHVDDMARVFPDARFVVVVRHPLASVASNLTRFTMPQQRASSHWRRFGAELARQAGRHPERMAFLRYEDLVQRPEPVLRELLDWLGEPWSDAVLEHHEVQRERGRGPRSGPAAPGEKRRPEGRIRVDEPLDASRIDKWTRTLTPAQQARLGAKMGPIGAFYGYAMDDPAPSSPLSASGALLAPGADVAARIDEFPDLDLRTPGPRPRYDVPYDPRKLMIVSVEDFERMSAPRGAHGLAVSLVRRLPSGSLRRAVARRGRRLRARMRRRGAGATA